MDTVVAVCASSCYDFVAADEIVVCAGCNVYSVVAVCAICCDVVVCDVVS